MANMFFPILTEETRDFSVLGVNILYLPNQQMSPSALGVLRSLTCARTQIPSQYTHIDLAIDVRMMYIIYKWLFSSCAIFHLTSPQGAN